MNLMPTPVADRYYMGELGPDFVGQKSAGIHCYYYFLFPIPKNASS